MDAVFDDAGLLQRYAAQRDAAAFAELVRRYADLVYGTARRVTGDASAAEDVSQDCFLRLAQRSGSISGSVAAWLHRTCVNRSLELRRSDQARRLREAAAATRRSETDPAAQLITQVDEVLAVLPDEARSILTEHFLLGRSQPDLAAALKVNQSTISRRIEQAVMQLRERLRAGGIAPAMIGALPMVLDQAKQTTAPAALPAALKKIGLSGVSATSAAAGGAGGTAALKLSAAAIVAIAGAAFLVHWRSSATPAGPAAAKPAVGAATTRAARAARDDELEIDDVAERLTGKDEHDEDDERDDKDEKDEK